MCAKRTERLHFRSIRPPGQTARKNSRRYERAGFARVDVGKRRRICRWVLFIGKVLPLPGNHSVYARTVRDFRRCFIITRRRSNMLWPFGKYDLKRKTQKPITGEQCIRFPEHFVVRWPAPPEIVVIHAG